MTPTGSPLTPSRTRSRRCAPGTRPRWQRLLPPPTGRPWWPARCAGATRVAAGRGRGPLGGTPLNDATAFAQWDAARLLVERGATVSPFDAAALGMTDRVAAALASGDVGSLDALLWGACHGGQLETASVLVDAGADLDWRGWDDLTPLGAAERAGAAELVAWLRAHGASP